MVNSDAYLAMRTETEQGVHMRTEAAAIEKAIIVLLKQMDEEDEKEFQSLLPDDGPKFIGELEAMSPTERRSRHLLRQPVRAACFYAVRVLGQRLHELDVALISANDRILEMAADEEEAGDWMSVIDKAWDGIGDWVA